MKKANFTAVYSDGNNVYVKYRMTDDADSGFAQEGTIPAFAGDTLDTISAKLAGFEDAANLADSLKPLINTQVQSATPLPDPISISPDPVVVSQPVP